MSRGGVGLGLGVGLARAGDEAGTKASPELIPRAGTLGVTGIARLYSFGSIQKTPGVGALALTGYAAALTPETVLIPNTGALALTGAIGYIPVDTGITPNVAALTLTGIQGSLSTEPVLQPSSGSIALTGIAAVPSVGTHLTPLVGSVTVTGVAAVRSTDKKLSPLAGSAVVTGRPAIATQGGVPQIIEPSTTALGITGIQVPGLLWQIDLTPAVAGLTLTGTQPTVLEVVDTPIQPASGELNVQNYSPRALAPITPDVGAITVSGYAAALISGTARIPSTGSLTLTGELGELVVTSPERAPATGTLSITGETPEILTPGLRTPQTGSIALTGQQAALADFFTFDNFNDNSLDTAKWNQWDNGTVVVAETVQQLHITLDGSGGSQYGGITSIPSFDLTGGWIAAELSTAPSSGNTDAYLALKSAADATDYLYLGKDNATLYAKYYVNGSPTTVASVAYNSTNHRWLRIRELSGVAYFEVSADGGSWTEIGNWTISGIDVTLVNIEVAAGTYDIQASPGEAVFDNVRIHGINKTVTPTVGAIALTGVAGDIEQTNYDAIPQGTIQANVELTPVSGALSLAGGSAAIAESPDITAQTGSITLTGTQPTLGINLSITPSAGALTAAGVAGDIEQTNYDAVPQGTIS